MSFDLSQSLVQKFSALYNPVLHVSSMPFHAVYNARGAREAVFSEPFHASFR